MALLPCPECQKQISDDAKTCPNCGYRVRIKNKKSGIRLVMAIVIAAIGIHLVLNGAAMPGGIAIFFGLFMILLGVVVIITTLWKIISD